MPSGLTDKSDIRKEDHSRLKDCLNAIEEDPKSLSPSLPGTKADPFHLASPPLATNLITLSVAKSMYSVDDDLPSFNEVL